MRGRPRKKPQQEQVIESNTAMEGAEGYGRPIDLEADANARPEVKHSLKLAKEKEERKKSVKVKDTWYELINGKKIIKITRTQFAKHREFVCSKKGNEEFFKQIKEQGLLR